MGLKNETERYLIIKMAEQAEQWEEPYDDMDREQMLKNKPFEMKYELYKDVFKELFCK